MWRTDGDGTVYYYAPYNQAPGLPDSKFLDKK